MLTMDIKINSSLIKQNYQRGKNKELESEKKVIADKAASKEAII